MKKITIVLCALMVLVVSYWAQARMMPVTKSGGTIVAGGSAAANQILEPTGTVSVGDWSNSDEDQLSLHTYIDDGASADDLTFIRSDTANFAVFSFASVTGTISAVRLHVRALCYSTTANNETINVTRDGTNWLLDTDIGALTDSFADYQVNFTSLSWDGASSLRVRIAGNTSFSEHMRISRIRLEINP